MLPNLFLHHLLSARKWTVVSLPIKKFPWSPGWEKIPWQHLDLSNHTNTSFGNKTGSVRSLMSSLRHSPGWQWHIQQSVEQHWTTSEQSGKSVSAPGHVCHNLVALRISKEEILPNRWLKQNEADRKTDSSHEREEEADELTERGWRFSSKISKSILPSVSLKSIKNKVVSLSEHDSMQLSDTSVSLKLQYCSCCVVLRNTAEMWFSNRSWTYSAIRFTCNMKSILQSTLEFSAFNAKGTQLLHSLLWGFFTT